MLIKKTVQFFTSLKLTVTLLAFAIVLVFIGTLAQADDGLYAAQSHYFRQWLVLGVACVWPGISARFCPAAICSARCCW